jgi:hypothetical protein
MVYSDISTRYPGCIRIRLKGNRACPANSGGEYSVTPNICTKIQKQIIRAKKVYQAAHFDEFVKPAIDIAGSACRAASYDEFGTLDPLKFDFRTQSARDLPCRKPAERR